jgi:CheY-like chemotaxis protein
MSGLRPILLVEDNLQDVELTLAALRSHMVANEVIVARHGGEALDYLRGRGPHAGRAPGFPAVVLLDLKMPKVDGLEVLRQMKGDPAMSVIPVVMLTSSREEADLVRSYRLGVNAYVVKPVGFDQFNNAILQLGVFWAVVNEPPPEPAGAALEAAAASQGASPGRGDPVS